VLVLPVDREVPALAWDVGYLVAPESGPLRWTPDGTPVEQECRGFGGPFGQSVTSADGRYRVLYAERGTKALLLDGHDLVREFDRSYYHAADYDYPVAVGTTADGREVVVHCPTRYDTLHIDDLHSGERLTEGRRLTEGQRQPIDVFHSRLSISPDGNHLLDVGWVWQPYGVALVYSLPQALADPASLDGFGVVPFHRTVGAEVANACWLDADRIAVTTSTDDDDDSGPDELGRAQVGVWSIGAGGWLHRSALGFEAGVILARGEQIVTLHGHPRLVDVATGRVVAEWPEVDTGRWTACYGLTHRPSPVVALHPDGTRLAVAGPGAVTVIELPAAPD
jgi:hypothetical protein